MNANSVRPPDESRTATPLPRSHPLLQALAAIGLASLLAAPGPTAIAAEPHVPILVRESGIPAPAGRAAGSPMLNDASLIAVRTSAPLRKAVSGLSLATSFSPLVVKTNEASKLKLQFTNNTGYGYFQVDAKSLGLPSGLVVASTPGVQKTCSGSVTANAGSSSIDFTSFSLGSEASCYFEIGVSGSGGGQKSITAQFTGDFEDGPTDVTLDANGSATLYVLPNPTTSFSPGTVSPG